MYIYICTYVLKKCKFLTSPHDRLLVRRVGRKFLQICEPLSIDYYPCSTFVYADAMAAEAANMAAEAANVAAEAANVSEK